MKREILCLSMLLLSYCSCCYAQEVLVNLENSSTTVLNEQLRSSRSDMRDAKAAISTLESEVDDINDKFDTSTGHDHDGTDSKKVLATNLDMTGITDGHYLYNNAGALAGKTITLAPTYTAGGAAAIASALTERSTSETAYTKLKEITLYGSGTLYITFEMKKASFMDAGKYAYGRIYRNGVAVGTEWSTTSDVYATYGQSISGWANGDKIQLYVKKTAGGPDAYIKNLIIFGTQCTIGTD